MALDPFAPDIGLDVTKPVEGLDPFAPPTSGLGPFRKGFGAGVAGVKSSLAGAGALAARVVGAKELEAAALEKAAAEAEVAAQANQPIEKVDFSSPSAVIDQFKWLLGNALPSLATMFAGGVVGRGLGALAGRGAAAAKRTGTLVGAVAPDVALEAGGIFPEALQTGVENPALRAIAGGTAAASLDFLPLLAAERYLKAAGRGGFGALVKGAAKGAPIGAVLEGAQETGQSAIERLSAGRPLTGDEALSDYINSFAGGAAPGLVFGAGIGAHRGAAAPREPTPVQVPPAFTSPEQPPIVNAPEPALPVLSEDIAPPLDLLNPLTEQARAGVYMPPGTVADPFNRNVSPEAQEADLTRRDMLVTQHAQLTARVAELEPVAAPVKGRKTSETVTAQRAAAAELETVKAQLGAITPELGALDEAIKTRRKTLDVLAETPVALNPAIVPKTGTVEPNLGIIQTKPETEPEAIDRAVKGVHALFREQGMLLGTTREALATPTKTPREVALEKVAGRAPRERVKPLTPEELLGEREARAIRTAQAAVEIVVAEKVKGSVRDYTPAKQTALERKYKDAVNSVVQEAAALPTLAERQKRAREDIPKALPGLDRETREAVADEVARTLYSRGAVDAWGLLSDPIEKTKNRAAVTKNARKGADLYAQNRDGSWTIVAGPYEVSGQGVKTGIGTDSQGYFNKDNLRTAETLPVTQNSSAALTSDQFHALPRPAQEAAADLYNRAMTELGHKLIARLRMLVGDDPHLTVSTYTAAPGGPVGGYTRTGPLKAIISMALNAKNGLSIADHEGFHYAEDRMLTSPERQIIANAFKPGRPLFEKLMESVRRYDLENKTRLADEVASIPAEARAYGFEFWRRGELQPEGALARIFEKIRLWFEKVANLVKGLGFQSVEDVFKALDLGQFAEREKNLASGLAGFDSRSAIGNIGAFDPSNPDITKSVGAVDLSGNAAFNDATKPDGIGKLLNDFGGSEFAAESPLGVVQATMLPMLKHDQIRRAVIEALPVDVVRILADNKFTPEQLIREPNMVRKALPVDLRAAVFGGVGDALMQVRARLGAALDRVLSEQPTGRQEEILPTLRAGQLNSREVVRLLSPLTLADTGPDTGRLGSTVAATEVPMSGASLDVAGIGNELSPARLAVALNRHAALQGKEGKTSNLVEKFQAPDENATRAAAGLPLFSKAAVDMRREMQEGALQRQQEYQNFTVMHDRAAEHGPDNVLTAAYGAVGSEIKGGLARWWQKNMATTNFVSHFSSGVKNVYRTLNTYIRYRKLLIENMLRGKMPTWYHASFADQDITFAALLKRTVNGYARSSSELAELRRGLETPGRQRMFDDATKMIEGFLSAELESDRQEWKNFYIPGYESLPADRKAEMDALIEQHRKITPEQAKLLSDSDRVLYDQTATYREEITDREAQVAELIDKGYVPLRRYGDHIVVVTAIGKGQEGSDLVVNRMGFESETRAAFAIKTYQDEIKNMGLEGTYRVEPMGFQHKSARETTMSARQFIDTARRNGVPLTQPEVERIVKALTRADSMMRNRMMRREGTPGYSVDGMRVLNEFGVGMSGKLAYAQFASAIDAAAAGRAVESDVVKGVAVIKADEPQRNAEGVMEDVASFEARNLWRLDGPKSGHYRNLADEVTDYVLVPDHTGEWSKKLRGAAMVYYLGNSISGAMVNTMSIPMLTVPELSLHTNYYNAMSTALSSWKQTWQYINIMRDLERLRNLAKDPKNAMPEIDAVPGLREAMTEAADVIFDTEVHQIMGMAQGTVYSKSRTVQRAVDAMMLPFRISEQSNRATSFIAAYKVGQQNGLSGQKLFTFARELVTATQNNYDPSNRPGLARNPITAIMFMFKSFPLFMIEAAVLMYKANPKTAVYMLLGLTMMTGVQGLPFAETLEDMIDTIAQRVFNSPFNTRRAMRNVIKQASEAIVGYDASELVLRGLINEVFGISASSRIGTGDFVPGTRLGTADADQGRVLEEMFGAPYAMLKDSLSQAGKLVSGAATLDWKQSVDALRAGGPVAVRNVIKGVEQLSDGYASDSKGRRLVDIGTPSAMFQLIGLSSAGLAAAYDRDRTDKQTLAFYTQVRADMEHQLASAIKAGDGARAQDVWDAATAWDASNPDMPLRLNPAAIRRQIVLSGLRLDERTLKLLPRQLRGTSLSAEGM